MYPSISPYTYCFNSPLKFVDVNGEKVYFIGALNELQGFDENEEPIYKQTKVIIDISNAEQVNDYLNNSFALDKDMLIAYSESKKIASTTDILKYFEQSTTEDIYIFKSTISLTSSANTKAVGNTYAQVKDVDNDGKFNPSKDINFSGIPLYLQYAAVDIAVAVEGLEIPIPTNGTLNFIQLDPELFSSNLQFHGYLIEDENFAIKTQVTATLHEIVDYVEASRNGIPVEQQHEVAFGTDTDLPQLAKDDSPFGKRENEINNIYDEDK